MCVDIFAPGRPITITFLHEQLWFDVGAGKITVEVICDAFIQNDSEGYSSHCEIEQLRIQLPYHVAAFGNDEQHSDVQCIGTPAEELGRYNWLGELSVAGTSARLNLGASAVEPDAAEHRGRLLRPAPLAALLPPAAANVDDCISAMRALDFCVFVLQLETPLCPGEVGWLRLRIRPRSWPTCDEIVPISGFPFLNGPTDYVTRLRFLSPEHLRRDIEQKLTTPDHEQWYRDLIHNGWRAYNTLVRVEDCRVSVLFPQDVDISNVSRVPEQSSVVLEPPMLPQPSSWSVLHFATGSIINSDQDVVGMAKRIVSFCNFMGAVSKEYLITRFGGSRHEAIGTLISEMIYAGVLQVSDPRDGLLPPNRADLVRGIISLRSRYTFQNDNRFLSEVMDLHPFSISMTLRWRALTPEQQRRMQQLDTMTDEEAAVLLRTRVSENVMARPFLFISYSHADSPFAAAFAKRLRKAGIEFFRDLEQIEWGTSIPEEIHTALLRATHLVVLISTGSDKSEWVSYEVGYARGRGIKVVPYLLHPSMEPPGFISSNRYIRSRTDEQHFIASLKAARRSEGEQ